MTLLEFPRVARERFGLNVIESTQIQIPRRDAVYIAALKQALYQADVQLLNMLIDVGNIADANAEWRNEDLVSRPAA
jgi:hypothetical protein